MTFWIITAAMAALVALVLGRAMWRGAAVGVADTAAYDLQVYRDQLAEVDRDVARGVVPSEDAERVRTEISRRILHTDAELHVGATTGTGPHKLIIAALSVVLIAGSLALYWQLGQPGYGDMGLANRLAFAEQMRETRPSQQAAEDSIPEGMTVSEIAPRYASLLEQLRTSVGGRPDDLQGHVLLAENEANVGNFPAAARAQAAVLRIKGPQATAQDIGNYAELLVLAAGGYVSPEAEAALRAVLLQDREDGRARYFIGLMMVQTGRPDLAFRIWDGLLRRGPVDAAWIDPIKSQIMAVAELAGVKYTLPAIGQGARSGPSAQDIEAASAMTAANRIEMIGGMVAGLSDRLATQGGPPEDWARLITSLGVLRESDRARAIYRNALEVFAGEDGALDVIRAAASQAGVAE